MPTTTTYGYKKPIVGENGSASGDGWAASINFNTDRLDAHDHDGVDSARLTATAITAVSQNLNNTVHGSDTTLGWVAQATGEYKRTVSMTPSSLTFDTYSIQARKYTSTSGAEDLWDDIYPTIEKTAVGTFDIYVNFNPATAPANGSSIVVKIIYTS